MAALQRQARLVFGGFGQTKVIEDCHHWLRDREARDTTNKTVAYANQWDVLRSKGTLEAHGHVQ
eukprot:4437094-Lingulodinium_polyedra.AAC.1